MSRLYIVSDKDGNLKLDPNPGRNTIFSDGAVSEEDLAQYGYGTDDYAIDVNNQHVIYNYLEATGEKIDNPWDSALYTEEVVSKAFSNFRDLLKDSELDPQNYDNQQFFKSPGGGVYTRQIGFTTDTRTPAELRSAAEVADGKGDSTEAERLIRLAMDPLAYSLGNHNMKEFCIGFDYVFTKQLCTVGEKELSHTGGTISFAPDSNLREKYDGMVTCKQWVKTQSTLCQFCLCLPFDIGELKKSLLRLVPWYQRGGVRRGMSKLSSKEILQKFLGTLLLDLRTGGKLLGGLLPVVPRLFRPLLPQSIWVCGEGCKDRCCATGKPACSKEVVCTKLGDGKKEKLDCEDVDKELPPCD